MGKNRETKNDRLEKTFAQPLTRRSFLKKSATGAAVAFTAASMGPFVRTSKAAKLELRWLGWEHYNVKKLTAKFEKQYNCKVSAGFFDGNSEAYNKLRGGGVKDFDPGCMPTRALRSRWITARSQTCNMCFRFLCRPITCCSKRKRVPT